MNQMYKVNEIFDSVQGEGVHSGVPATFIRTQGCPVGCAWCDTKYTWSEGGEWMSARQIVEKVNNHHVVITGGEPLLWNLDDMLSSLAEHNHYVQVETSGFCWLKGHRRPRWITWSPKPNLKYAAPKNMYHAVNEIKFVVTPDLTHDDVMGVWDMVIKAHKDWNYPYVVLMPEGCPPPKENMDLAYAILNSVAVHKRPKYGNLWRVSDRLQWRLGVR